MPLVDSLNNPQVFLGFWNEKQNEKPPFLFEQLFETQYVEGSNVEVIYGEDEAGKTLSLTQDDVNSIRRKSNNFRTKSYPLLKFKNHKYMDERRMRSITNAMANNQSQAIVDSIVRTQLNDSTSLLDDAMLTREAMAMQALTTGKIHVNANSDDRFSENGNVDFDIPEENRITLDNPENDGAKTIEQVLDAISDLNSRNNTVIGRAIMNRQTFNKLGKSSELMNRLTYNGQGTISIIPSSDEIKQAFQDLTGAEIVVYDKGILGKKFIPDNKIVFTKLGTVGRMVWTDTQEVLALSDDPSSNLDTSDNGITVNITKEHDPAGTKVLVSESFLPAIDDFNSILIADFAEKKN